MKDIRIIIASSILSVLVIMLFFWKVGLLDSMEDDIEKAREQGYEEGYKQGYKDCREPNY